LRNEQRDKRKLETEIQSGRASWKEREAELVARISGLERAKTAAELEVVSLCEDLEKERKRALVACKDRSELQEELRKCRKQAEGFEVALGETGKLLQEAREEAAEVGAAATLVYEATDSLEGQWAGQFGLGMGVGSMIIEICSLRSALEEKSREAGGMQMKLEGELKQCKEEMLRISKEAEQALEAEKESKKGHVCSLTAERNAAVVASQEDNTLRRLAEEKSEVLQEQIATAQSKLKMLKAKNEKIAEQDGEIQRLKAKVESCNAHILRSDEALDEARADLARVKGLVKGKGKAILDLNERWGAFNLSLSDAKIPCRTALPQ
jgi:chromosome segregation ATPase